jgi:hypothetical protein
MQWASALPTIGIQYAESFSIIGVLVHYDSDHIRIVVDDIALSLATEDVIGHI